MFLVDFLKNSQNKPTSNKVDQILKTFAQKKLNIKEENVNEEFKEMLLNNLKKEFLKEKENFEKGDSTHSPSHSPSPIKNKAFIKKIF